MQALEDWTKAFYLKSRAEWPSNPVPQFSNQGTPWFDQSASELPDQAVIHGMTNYLSNLRMYIQRISSDNFGNLANLTPLYLLTVPAIWTDKLRNDICITLNKDFASEKLVVLAKPEAAISYAASKKKIELQDEDCIIVCDVSGLVVRVQY